MSECDKLPCQALRNDFDELKAERDFFMGRSVKASVLKFAFDELYDVAMKALDAADMPDRIKGGARDQALNRLMDLLTDRHKWRHAKDLTPEAKP